MTCVVGVVMVVEVAEVVVLVLDVVLTLQSALSKSGTEVSHVMRKNAFGICEQQSRRSACVSTQSDQRLCCSLPR